MKLKPIGVVIAVVLLLFLFIFQIFGIVEGFLGSVLKLAVLLLAIIVGGVSIKKSE